MPNPTPVARLRAIAALATALADEWPTYEATEASIAAPTLAAAGGGSGRSTAVPDPTAGVAFSHERYWATAAEVTEALGHLRFAQRNFDAARAHHPNAALVEAAARNARCSGEIDPTCVRNAVTRDGLCSACYQRKRRHAQAS